MSAPTPQMHTGFLLYRRGRWAYVAAALAAISGLAYVLHHPHGAPNGGTWLGYALGTIGAALVVWLAWLGVRKRRYRSSGAPVQGWLSAHVYLGLALLLVGTLHTGLHFGWNIHTLAYALMLCVIASGAYGVIAYSRYPSAITRHHAQGNRDAWLAEVFDLGEQALAIADRLGADVHRVVLRSNDRLRIGGNFLQQLRGIRPQTDVASLLPPMFRSKLEGERSQDLPATSTVMFMASRITRADKLRSGVGDARQLLDVLAQRNALVERINEDLRLHARMQVWLYLHVPLTLALLAALIAHIVAVFIYW